MGRWDKIAEAIAMVATAFFTGMIWMLWLAEPYHGF